MKIEFTVPHNDNPDVVRNSALDELERLGVDSMLEFNLTREGAVWRVTATEPRFGPTREPLNELPAILGVVELARYLGVPVQTVRAWRYKDTGPRSFLAGRHVRYRREDVETWIAEQARS